MLSSEEKKRITEDLNQCQTVGEVFAYLAKKYQLENCKLGFLTKKKYIEGTITAINALNPKPR